MLLTGGPSTGETFVPAAIFQVRRGVETGWNLWTFPKNYTVPTAEHDFSGVGNSYRNKRGMRGKHHWRISNLLDDLVLKGIQRVSITAIHAEQHSVQHQKAFPGDGFFVLKAIFSHKRPPHFHSPNKTRHYSYKVNYPISWNISWKHRFPEQNLTSQGHHLRDG